MRKVRHEMRRLELCRESIRVLATGPAKQAVGGASGEDCTARFTNCPTIPPTLTTQAAGIGA
jgi:hypothetical protein